MRDARIVAGINVSIGPLDRIALLGPNGAGKSTLTKMLAGDAAPLAGRRIARRGSQPSAILRSSRWSSSSRIAMPSGTCAIWADRILRRAMSSACATTWEDSASQGDRAFDPVERFSGGEKARLTLALLVARRPNLLLLDEPTNHLDIDMRHALTVALQSFEGGMVIVSHDRHLIKTVADSLGARSLSRGIAGF